MTTGRRRGTGETARAAVAGARITGVSWDGGVVEIRLGDVVLTGMTTPFGMIGCHGVGPRSLPALVGRVVDDLSVHDDYVALDSGENRVAFPIGGSAADGRESVRLVRADRPERGIAAALWVW